MKRKIITLQFIENGLIILNQKEIKEYILKSVNNYQIINKDTFIEEMTLVIEKNKLNNNLLTTNINIIIDNTYTSFYLHNIETIFKELSFNKIRFTNIIDIINLKNDELIVDISTSNIKILSKTLTINSHIYNKNHKSILTIYLRNLLKEHNITTIYLYGQYPYTSNFIKYIEKISNCKTYTYTYPNQFPIQLLI